jgi:acyl phosphate:glycerol-3-phosphate acyltransferase
MSLLLQDPVTQYALLLMGFMLLAYVFGSIPTAYIVAKQVKGIDIREHGSGNVGATNVSRVVGKRAGQVVLGLDFFKGLIPVVVARCLFPNESWLPVVVSLAAIIGHSKSVFLGFTGGKSAITGLGTMLAQTPVTGLLLGLIAYAVSRLTKTVSIGTLATCVMTPILLVLFKEPVPAIIYGSVAAAYVAYLHKANIQRLLNGQENRLS